MFEKKKCSNCGEKIKDNWRFCPNCGKEIKVSKHLFDMDEFERKGEDFESDFKFPDFKIKPMMKAGGISIIIQSGTGMEPRVNVKTSGEYKRMEPGIKREMGIKTGAEGAREERTERKRIKERITKTTEEPEAETQNAGNRKIIFIRLPDVKSEDDIEIRRLEQSVEIKAYAGDKAYFKLIPIPANALVTDEFDKGMLKLEILK
jgi:hypothetical protein